MSNQILTERKKYYQILEKTQRSDSRPPTSEAPKVDARAKRQEAAQRRNALRPLQQTVTQQEKKLEQCQQTLAALEAELADETLYQPDQKTRLTELVARQGRLRQEQDALEADLLDAMEALEAAEQALL